MTAHWICPDSLERRCAALCCQRIQGKHTFDVLANAMAAVHEKFQIQGKVVATTTDNGSNFVKAFR